MSEREQLWGPRPVTLQGRYATLVPLAATHLDDLLVAAADPEIWRYLPMPAPTQRAELEAFLAVAEQDTAAGRSLAFAILEPSSGRAVGTTRYMDVRPADRGVEIGWTWLAREVWRTAINTECKYLLLRHAFEDLSALRVQFRTDSRNERSRQAIQRIGGQLEGMLRSDRVLWNGYVRDSAVFSIILREWPDVRHALEHRLASTH